MVDYLDWESPLAIEQVFAGSGAFSYPDYTSDGQCLYLGAIKEEKNRAVLMLCQAAGEVCITPTPFSLQTKVNEYGGKPYWVFDDHLVFANQSDQCLYRQSLKNGEASKPARITPKPDDSTSFMYTDVHSLGNGQYLAIVEMAGGCRDTDNKMFIGLISDKRDAAPLILCEGSDFYSNLVLNNLRNRIAWVQWQHPCMPWDETELWTANISVNSAAELSEINAIDLGSDVSKEPSVCQLLFAKNDYLFFSADFKTASENDNYWSLHAYDFQSQKLHRVGRQNFNETIEFGYPHWVYGDKRIVQLDDHRLLAIGSLPQGDQLFVIDQNSLSINGLGETGATLQHLTSYQHGKCVLLELAQDRAPCLVQIAIELSDHQDGMRISKRRELIASESLDFDISIAEHIAFPTRDGQHAYGFYYAPHNVAFQNRTNGIIKPPLIVMVHGGPTARAYGNFDLQKQFWTSRGFAIFDVNHRGSSGYGRRYRDALYGEWGERDTCDIIDGISYLIDRDYVDPSRICIRGKSAGGYAVLRALTEFPSIFKAGACYYGIGNLVTLAETTHKFEKHYTDRLVEEVFDPNFAKLPESKFYQRSPINKISDVGSAMIIFQGALDKVVPREVAQEIVAALRGANLDYDYVEYHDEAHGFRQTSNSIDALGQELAFFRRILAA